MSQFKGLARIVVFGAEYCRFCKNAQSLLASSKARFSYLDVDEDDNMELLSSLQRKYKYSTIPMIFVDEQFIGGFQELSKMVKD
jgi:glutaredoxin 3